LQPRSSRWLRWLLRRLLRGRLASRPIPQSLGGGRLWFRADRHLGLFFARSAAEEAAVARTLVRLCRPGELFFDVGANIGFHTVVVGRRRSGCRIIALEPGPDAAAVLRTNVERNGLVDVVIEERALSEAASDLPFYEDLATGRTSSLEPEAWHPDGPSSLAARLLTTTTLDAVAAQHGQPTVVKCDVEGHELKVLAGAAGTLAAGAAWVVEVTAATGADVADLFARHGYACLDAERPEAGESAARSATHLLAVRPEHLDRLRAT
jgi:FkbM family methyltransferase